MWPHVAGLGDNGFLNSARVRSTPSFASKKSAQTDTALSTYFGHIGDAHVVALPGADSAGDKGGVEAHPLCDMVRRFGPEFSGPHISASKNKKAIRLQNGWLGLTNSASA
jgi:hypothetical protein